VSGGGRGEGGLHQVVEFRFRNAFFNQPFVIAPPLFVFVLTAADGHFMTRGAGHGIQRSDSGTESVASTAAAGSGSPVNCWRARSKSAAVTLGNQSPLIVANSSARPSTMRGVTVPRPKEFSEILPSLSGFLIIPPFSWKHAAVPAQHGRFNAAVFDRPGLASGSAPCILRRVLPPKRASCTGVALWVVPAGKPCPQRTVHLTSGDRSTPGSCHDHGPDIGPWLADGWRKVKRAVRFGPKRDLARLWQLAL